MSPSFRHLGLAAVVYGSSALTLGKLFGAGWGALATLSIIVCAAFVLRTRRFREISARLHGHTAWISVLLLGVVIVAVELGYAMASSGRFGPGSDSDDALIVAVRELLEGRYPYAARTYLGNPLSPMPGSVLLAMPFVLLGHIELQSVFWLGLFGLAVARWTRDARMGFLLMLLFVSAPGVQHGLCVGSDYLANGAFVALACGLWLVEGGARARLLWALPLGLALSSRPSFLPILPLFIAAHRARHGTRAALWGTLLICVSFCAVTLPFALWNPAAFSPLHVLNKLSQFESLVPGAASIIIGVDVVVALLLCRAQDGDLRTAARASTLVLVFPIVCGVVLSSVRAGRLELGFTGVMNLALCLGALATIDALTDGIVPVCGRA